MEKRPSGCCLGCMAIVVCATMFMLFLLIGSSTGGAGFLVGAIVACMPAPFYVALALWLDRYEPEPPHLLFAAFLWGATGAVFFAFLLNTFNALVFLSILGDAGVANAADAVISAPLVEESCKGIFLFLLFFFARNEFDGIVDGVIYATMVALGFAMTENIQYYGMAFSQGGGAGLAVLSILRGVLSPYAHPLFTCMTGVGLGWARQTRSLAVKLLAPLGGLGCAMALHCLWNLTATLDTSLWFLAYLFIMVPTALVLLAVVGFALRRESRLLRTHLLPEVEQARLTRAEYDRLLSVPRRIGHGFRSFYQGGPASWMAYERFSSTASELAFLRDRVERRLVDAAAAAQQESQYQARLAELRQRFRG